MGQPRASTRQDAARRAGFPGRVDTHHRLDGRLDIAAHNQDLRGALDMPGDRESAAVALSLQRYVAGLSQRIAAAGLPALRLCTERGEHVAGHGSPSSTVITSEWELFRALCGRRSTSQIRSLRWSGDAEIYLPLLPAYGLPGDDLIE